MEGVNLVCGGVSVWCLWWCCCCCCLCVVLVVLVVLCVVLILYRRPRTAKQIPIRTANQCGWVSLRSVR